MRRFLTMVLMASALSLAQGVTIASASDEPYYMADVQATVNLPPRWQMTTWADWEFKAKAGDGSVMMTLSYTPFQVEPTEEAAMAWADMHADQLRESKAEGVERVDATVGTRRGRPSAEMTLNFRFPERRGAVVYHATAFPLRGKVVHVATMAAAGNARRSQEALSWLVDNLEVAEDREAEPTDGLGGEVDSQAGFEADLPDGWRCPTPGEMTRLSEVVTKTGQGRFDPEACWVALRTLAGLEPDAMLFCNQPFYLPKVDDRSWEGVEPQVHRLFFGKAGDEVPPGVKVDVGDRIGFLYSPPAKGEAVRMAVAPYDQGVMVGWGVADQGRGDVLDEELRAVLGSTRFTGPDGAHAPVGLAGWLSYAFKYRKTDPLYFGPFFLFVGLFGFMLVKLARKQQPTYDDM